jgi:hypothetical protein
MTDTGLTASLLSNMGISRWGGLVYDITLCEVTIDCYLKQLMYDAYIVSSQVPLINLQRDATLNIGIVQIWKYTN